MDVTIFRPKVIQILKVSDLDTVSAKKVRKQLQSEVGLDLTAHKVRVNHGDVPGTPVPVAKVEQVEPTIVHSTPKRQKVKHEVKDERVSDFEEEEEDPDVKYARELQAQYDSPRASRSGGAKTAPKRKRAVAKKKRMETIVNSDGETVEVEVKRKVVNNGFNKLLTLSDELAELLGVKYLSRPQVSKQVWAYIKKPENGLQDTQDKRYINCDAKLESLLGTPRIHMFTMTKLLQKHMRDDGTAPIGYGDGTDVKAEDTALLDSGDEDQKAPVIKKDESSSSEDE